MRYLNHNKKFWLWWQEVITRKHPHQLPLRSDIRFNRELKDIHQLLDFIEEVLKTPLTYTLNRACFAAAWTVAFTMQVTKGRASAEGWQINITAFQLPRTRGIEKYLCFKVFLSKQQLPESFYCSRLHSHVKTRLSSARMMPMTSFRQRAAAWVSATCNGQRENVPAGNVLVPPSTEKPQCHHFQC